MPNKRLHLGILSFGNILEWYDFSLYIYFAHSIAQQFFPSNDKFISYLLALSTFFIGSLARPLGGLLLGWLGDRYNHHKLINIAIIIMGSSTFAVALLPNYQMIGITAPILLIILRILQGLSAGGQLPGLITLAVKDFTHNRGFTVGLVFSVSSFGFLLASVIAFIMAQFIPAHLEYISWRLPFALSGILFIFYLYLNRKFTLNHYPNNSVVKQHNVFISLLQQWRAILAVVALTSMCASLYYLIFTYLVGYRITHLGVSEENAFLLNSIVLLLACILYPVFGQLADKLGYYRIFMLISGLLLIGTYPLLWLFRSEDTIAPLIALILFTICMAAMQGAISPLFAAAFKKDWIATGCALAYSIGNGLSGGAPLLAETLNHYFKFGLTAFIMILLIIGFFGMWLIRKVLLLNSKTAQI